MAFSAVPKESKSQINNAGCILVQGNSSSEEFRWALDLADRWRACHAYPINTFQATLRTKLARYNDPIAAQRLKRMPTIIDKLKRYPAMKLTTMQDIGGVRAILTSVKDVHELADNYRHSRRLAHDLVYEKDYIRHPRSEDGYRSVHLIYRYKNTQAPDYDGLRLELQIRTKLQHWWATAVESMGTFLGQALKSRQGDQAWLDFFALTSSAFAHTEGCVPVPRFKDLSKEDTFVAVADAEVALGALDMMRTLSAAAKEISEIKGSGQGLSYHLIVLDSEERTVEITPYDRGSLKQALTDYGRVEAEAAKGKKIEPVLVSAGPIRNLRRAYPNFFLDIKDFVTTVSGIVSAAKRSKDRWCR
jgi:ppGpp synthetase/RelA/SpoT-type nucleotidyltranferase